MESTVKTRGPYLLVGLLATGVAAAGVWYFWPRPEPAPMPEPQARVPVPPLPESPFLNTRPGVTFVGDAGCTGCHATLSKSYHQHPMGKSFYTAADFPPIERYNDKNPFEVKGIRYEVKRRGDKLIHREWHQDDKGNVLMEQEAEVAYVMGSGTQGRSYLIERDSFLFQSPISWYTKSGWGLAPGYEKKHLHFTRPIAWRCVFCHCNTATPVPHTDNQYRTPVFESLAIGCERCHGPGSLHVASRKKGVVPEDVDYTIVNPRHLPAPLRDAVCEQCHLQGEQLVVKRGREPFDFRPGLPLEAFFAVYVKPPERTDTAKAVSHVEQMYMSACFKKSGGKFGCISCHDPHYLPPPEKKDAYYRARCLECHQKTPCTAPVVERDAKKDSCIVCHMEHHSGSTIAHSVVTEHRVVRHPDRPPWAHSGLGPRDIPLLAFHRDRFDAKDSEAARDMAIALVTAARQPGMEKLREEICMRAKPGLDRAVKRDPDDVAAWVARGVALGYLGLQDEALASFQAALAKAPRGEDALRGLADLAERTGRPADAIAAFERLAAAYPHAPWYPQSLARQHLQRKDWPQVFQAGRLALRLDPFNADARALLAIGYHETADRARAAAELRLVGFLDPGLRKALSTRFGEP